MISVIGHSPFPKAAADSEVDNHDDRRNETRFRLDSNDDTIIEIACTPGWVNIVVVVVVNVYLGDQETRKKKD